MNAEVILEDGEIRKFENLDSLEWVTVGRGGQPWLRVVKDGVAHSFPGSRIKQLIEIENTNQIQT